MEIWNEIKKNFFIWNSMKNEVKWNDIKKNWIKIDLSLTSISGCINKYLHILAFPDAAIICNAVLLKNIKWNLINKQMN